MLLLHIANKNYSSWSLRPWILLRELGIPFIERLTPFDEKSSDTFKTFSPTGKVPCLVDGETVIWDSLAIAEYVAEDHPQVWPADRIARAWARSASAEMHSSFGELRNHCGMNCGLRVKLHKVTKALQADWARVDELWCDGLSKSGGPFLAGERFTAVDAFYAPVAFRVQTYSPELSAQAQDYTQRLRTLSSMRAWYSAALREPWRDVPHEAEVRSYGVILQDERQLVS